MKILIVDDNYYFVKETTEKLRDSGLDVDKFVGGNEWDELSIELVRNADVIFLDHNMPGKNGKEYLEYWTNQGIDMTNKRVVGISCDSQPYLREKLDPPSTLYYPDRVKKFLGIS